MVEERRRRGGGGHEGFSLIEVVVATAIVATALVSVIRVQLLAISVNQLAQRVTVATALATQKIEQLTSLAWFVDAAGNPVLDTASDLTASPESPVGGSGLLPSPATALSADAAGFVDYLDATGAWLGAGTTPPRDTAFVRRWSIRPLASCPDRVLLLQVLVTRQVANPAPPSSLVLRPGDVLLTTLRSRRAG